MVGEPVDIEIDDVIWNDQIERHLARHSVSRGNVLAVLTSAPLIFENLPNRGGTHVMVGPDDEGRVLYVAIRPTGTAGVWEPVTGWQSRLARRLWAEEGGEQE